MKTLSSKALAVAVGAAVMMQAYAPTIASADEETFYISEVYLSYGETDEKAKQWLTDNGYTVLDQNLNESAEGGGKVLNFLGLGSEKRSVYLGYKTTTDEDNAITDMRAMNMKGEYSFEEYEKLLESKKAEITSFIEDMKNGLAEYRENYNKGVVKAKLAHDRLNTFTDDDCDGKGLGDLLLNPIKEEMTEEEYKKAEKDHVDMTTLVMQGNTKSVQSVMSYLAYAADTSDTSWLTRLNESGGLDGLISKYEKEYPNLSESKLNSLMASDYDEKAKLLAEHIEDLKESVKPYTDSKLKADADEAAVKAYFAEHTDENNAKWSIGAMEYIPMTKINFEEGTLADLVSGDKYNFTNAEDRMVLYPIIDSMSKGQSSLLEYIDLGEMIVSGCVDADGWKKISEENKDKDKTKNTLSVYSGIDRSVFEPAGVALTSEAREIQNTSGSSYTNKLFGVDTSTLQLAGYTSSFLTLAVGLNAYFYGKMMPSARLEALGERLEELTAQANENVEELANKLREYYINNNHRYVVMDFRPVSVSAMTDEQILKHFDMQRDPGAVNSVKLNVMGDPDADFGTHILETDEEFRTMFEQRAEANEEFNNLIDSISPYQDDEELINHFNQETKGWKITGAVLCVAGILLAIGSAAVTLYDVYKFYHQEYSPIPRKIVHESTDEKGRSVYTVYDCTLCNRNAQGFGNPKLGNYGDMNGDVGKQWIALYTTSTHHFHTSRKQRYYVKISPCKNGRCKPHARICRLFLRSLCYINIMCYILLY